ncbi:MAG: inositol monophosphatase [Akkermansiaceae bacterium]|nr:inositol monophosphatase [Akkermansiaceae bacterium]
MMSYLPQLQCAEHAARQAGELLRRHFLDPVREVDDLLAHDVKLRLDKECQQLIYDTLHAAYPDYAFLGEEGGSRGEIEWIVDPLDGTVNYYYGLPLFCVSIALRVQGETMLGCVYAPMLSECFCALRGGPALLNGQPIHTSSRAEMAQAIVFAGHGTHDGSGEAGLRRFGEISRRVRKMRILGSAALSLCYIAAGRLDAYIEQRIHLWDFAAAQVILESAGGILEFTPAHPGSTAGSVTAWNNCLPLRQLLADLP